MRNGFVQDPSDGTALVFFCLQLFAVNLFRQAVDSPVCSVDRYLHEFAVGAVYHRRFQVGIVGTCGECQPKVGRHTVAHPGHISGHGIQYPGVVAPHSQQRSIHVLTVGVGQFYGVVFLVVVECRCSAVSQQRVELLHRSVSMDEPHASR